jgi:hypothetical protein
MFYEYILEIFNGLIQFTLFLMGKFNSKVEQIESRTTFGTDCVRHLKVHCILLTCVCFVYDAVSSYAYIKSQSIQPITC